MCCVQGTPQNWDIETGQETGMSTQTNAADSKTVEDGIKIALDAADAATNVTGEFSRIKQEYAAVEGEVKKIYRNATIVFASSAAASLIAVVAASMMYYRTIETMETSNNTSLEALVIFAENVDKLAASTTALNKAMEQQSQLAAESKAAGEALGRIEEAQGTAQEMTAKGMADLSETTNAAVSQFSTAVLEKFDTGLMAHSEEVRQALADLNLAQVELVKMLTPEPKDGAAPQAPMEEIKAKLDTVMLLQKEISAKITAANSPPPKKIARKPVVKKAPAKAVDAPIKYP
jgi:hypothetical protein